MSDKHELAEHFDYNSFLEEQLICLCDARNDARSYLASLFDSPNYDEALVEYLENAIADLNARISKLKSRL